MNNEARKTFWKSLSQAKELKDGDMLATYIEYPKNIYRYRSVSSNSLSSLQTNTLFFSSSDYYDDPFDTNVHIDVAFINTIIDGFVKNRKEIPEEAFDKFRTMVGYSFTKEILELSDDKISMGYNLLIDIVSTEIRKTALSIYFLKSGISENLLIDTVRTEIRKTAWSICFSESGVNENLWLKYADHHKGFILEYNVTNDELILCGKQEYCSSCGMSTAQKLPYPVYYSDKKYDATKFVLCYLWERILNTINTTDSMKVREILMTENPCHWERERITLIKKECHHYDQEWRIIVPDFNAGKKTYLKWIPTSVILGLKTPQHERELIITLAQKAGINAIKEVFINKDDELEIRNI